MADHLCKTKCNYFGNWREFISGKLFSKLWIIQPNTCSSHQGESFIILAMKNMEHGKFEKKKKKVYAESSSKRISAARKL